MTELTKAQYDTALANCTRAEKDLLRKLVNSDNPSQAIRLLEIKSEFPSAQLVDLPPETKNTVMVPIAREHARSEQLSAEWTEDAILKADANAPEEWKKAALMAVEQVCRTKRIFTPDDVWMTGLEKPPTPQALGHIMRSASSLGWCKPTGAFVPSQIPTQHKNPIREWESLLVPHDEDLVDKDDEIGTLL